jgi:ABC-type branched-subunit amino acid transport system substrate-binding protein
LEAWLVLRSGMAALFLVMVVLALAACARPSQRSIPSPTPPAQGAMLPAPAPPVGPQVAMEPTGAVKVGLLLPMTGQQAELGQSLYKAAELALFDIAEENFVLVTRDTQSTPEGAAAAAREALNEGVQLILGPVFGADAQRVAPATRAAGVSIITFSTDRNVAGPGVYVMGILPSLQVQRIVNYAARQDLRRIGALVPANAYGQAVVDALQEAAPRAGVEVGTTTTYDPGADDKAFYASQLAAAGYQAVLIPEGGESLKAMAPALFGSTQLLGTTLWDDPALASLPYLQGAWFAAPPADRRASFEQKYASLHGKTPPRLATIVYDAVALAAALSKANIGFGPNALAQPGGFSGLDGIFRFRPDGTVERGLAVMEFANGRIVVRDPAAASFDEIIF